MSASRAALLIASASLSSRVIVTFLVAIQTPYQSMASPKVASAVAYGISRLQTGLLSAKR